MPLAQGLSVDCLQGLAKAAGIPRLDGEDPLPASLRQLLAGLRSPLAVG